MEGWEWPQKLFHAPSPQKLCGQAGLKTQDPLDLQSNSLPKGETRLKYLNFLWVCPRWQQNHFSRMWFGPRQANLVFIAYASSEGSGEPAHLRSLTRISATRSYKQWIKRNLQTESQIPGPLWMAGHGQLKFVMAECSKTQIRLMGLICL